MNKGHSGLTGYARRDEARGDAMLLKGIFLYWPLLSIMIVAVLCRLVHNAKLADRAVEKTVMIQDAFYA
ncbi:hypothetical protein [Pseudomonas sp. RIT-PI-q]|uniref:hypothetical protein n=1 Tax=Pseudomonas sp. RIT-PI-q TaxID=1690247 RepID=UPI00128EDE93|nr:hypothetical protein [Pseudomonas sp. RIT-PI-q]